MRLDDRPANGEAKPHSGCLATDERMKHCFFLPGDDANARIFDGDADHAEVSARRDHDSPALASSSCIFVVPAFAALAFAYRFHGVADQIEQYLLDMDPIDQYRTDVWRNIHVTGDAA